MTTVNSHLTKGLQYARIHDYTKAETEFDLLLSNDRTHALAYYYRGCVRIHLIKLELAIKDFDSAISSLQLPIEYELLALYKRGFAYQKLCQFELSLDNYRQFLNRAKKENRNDCSHKAYFSIGNIYALLNQNEQAVCYFDNAIRTSNDSNEDKQKIYYLHRGRAYAFCTNFEAAQKDLNSVIRDSNDPFIKGCAYNELGQHDKALDEFKICLENKFQYNNQSYLLDDYIQFRCGLSYASLNDHNIALENYQHILDNPNRLISSSIADRIYFRKGMSNMALNSTNNSLKDFNKSILLNNRQADVFYARGMLHYTLGRHDAAVHDHRRAIELNEKNPLFPSIYQTLYHTHNYIHKDTNSHLFHQKKLREAEAALRHCKEQDLNPEEQHRRIAEHKQQLAPYTYDPETMHNSARKHIQDAFNSSTNNMQIYDNITLAINDLYAAQMLCDKYPGGISSERIVNQFIERTMDGILKMSKEIEKCAVENNWNNLFNTLYELDGISHTNANNPFNFFRLKFIRIELDKSKMIQKTSKKFQNLEQSQFYIKLVICLCNLFDATRAATTGIFQHALTGTFTKVSYIPKILGYLCDFLPVGSEAAKNIFSLCEAGSKKLDEIRIQNALIHVGCLDEQKKLNEAADKIVEKLTIMYKQQIQKFSTKINKSNSNKKNEPCCCIKCFQRCCTCLQKYKNKITNQSERSDIQSIVQYASELLVNSLAELNTSKIENIDDLNDFFVRSICRLDYLPKIYLHIVTTEIQPTDREEKDSWNTYEFFRRPAIQFEENHIRADKYMDKNKFDCREPSWEEFHWYKNDTKKLDDCGLKIINEN